MTICCPGDPIEAREIIERSFDYEGPMYIRLGKSGERKIHNDETRIEIGKAIPISQGDDAALITTGNTLELGHKISERLRQDGIGVFHLSMPTVKPIDVPAIQQLIESGMPLFTLEEHNVIGGLGSAVAEIIAESNRRVIFHRTGIQDIFVSWVGGQEYLREKCGMNELEKKIRGVLSG
jgi:transketolase